MLELSSIPLVPNHFQEKKQLFISLQYVYPSRDLTFCSQDSESSLEAIAPSDDGLGMRVENAQPDLSPSITAAWQLYVPVSVESKPGSIQIN